MKTERSSSLGPMEELQNQALKQDSITSTFGWIELSPLIHHPHHVQHLNLLLSSVMLNSVYLMCLLSSRFKVVKFMGASGWRICMRCRHHGNGYCFSVKYCLLIDSDSEYTQSYLSTHSGHDLLCIIKKWSGRVQ